MSSLKGAPLSEKLRFAHQKIKQTVEEGRRVWVADLAIDDLHMSKGYFTHEFRRQFGQSPKHFF